MNVRAESHADHTLVVAEGRIDYNSAASFQAELERAIAGTRAPSAVVLDCGTLEYVSSAGLRAFLVGARAAQKAGVAFMLCGLQPAVLEVFKLSGFSQIMAIHKDREAALAQVRAPRT